MSRLALAHRRLGAAALDELPDLAAEAPGRREELVVRLLEAARQELDRADDPARGPDREAERRVEPGLGRGVPPREVRVGLHIGDPGRSRARPDASGEPRARRERGVQAHPCELGEPPRVRAPGCGAANEAAGVERLLPDGAEVPAERDPDRLEQFRVGLGQGGDLGHDQRDLVLEAEEPAAGAHPEIFSHQGGSVLAARSLCCPALCMDAGPPANTRNAQARRTAREPGRLLRAREPDPARRQHPADALPRGRPGRAPPGRASARRGGRRPALRLPPRPLAPAHSHARRALPDHVRLEGGGRSRRSGGPGRPRARPRRDRGPARPLPGAARATRLPTPSSSSGCTRRSSRALSPRTAVRPAARPRRAGALLQRDVGRRPPVRRSG